AHPRAGVDVLAGPRGGQQSLLIGCHPCSPVLSERVDPSGPADGASLERGPDVVLAIGLLGQPHLDQQPGRGARDHPQHVPVAPLHLAWARPGQRSLYIGWLQALSLDAFQRVDGPVEPQHVTHPTSVLRAVIRHDASTTARETGRSSSITPLTTPGADDTRSEK